ncbi:MAG: PIN domain-containing protein [Gemmataceae bacterium]|nr:PIN domain-containing protein [Gemmataceae bacterium]
MAIHGRARDALRAKWTGRIHREWVRAVRRNKPELLLGDLHRTCRLMDQHVRGCRVRHYERWEQRLSLPDPNDRHVLAAAIACVADVIVTFNVGDFPADILRPFGITAVEPDTFLVQLLDTGFVVSAAAEHRASLRRPPMSVAEYLDALRRNKLPGTAAALATDHEGHL